MSDTTPKRTPPKQTHEEAAAWFARLSQLSVTTDTLREFRDWKRRDGNAQAYARIEAAWDKAGRLRHDAELQALTQGALAQRPPSTSRRLAAPALAGLGLTAAAAIAFTLLAAAPTYRTGVGEQRLITLADGTRLRLNTDSQARVRLTRTARTVELQRGEAFFDVRHDPTRPFVVLADGARISDLGTRFDVRRLPQAVQVTLVEGQVQVAATPHSAPTTLAPNQQLQVGDQGLSQPKPIDAAQAASWTTGRLIFHGVPLEAAVAEVNRYSTTKIVLDTPPPLAAQPVSGVFDTGDTSAFVAAVRTLFSLQTRVDPQGAVHLAAPATAPLT